MRILRESSPRATVATGLLLAALYGIIGGHCLSTLLVEGRISAPLVTHPTWKFVHILLFVYRLVADLGMFVLARAARQPGLSFGQRYLLLRMAMLIEVTPRVPFILMIPAGLQLAAGLGFIDVAAPALLGIGLASLGWIALVIGYLNTTKPLHIQPSRDF